MRNPLVAKALPSNASSEPSSSSTVPLLVAGSKVATVPWVIPSSSWRHAENQLRVHRHEQRAGGGDHDGRGRICRYSSKLDTGILRPGPEQAAGPGEVVVQ